jgi:hypothetical protein
MKIGALERGRTECWSIGVLEYWGISLPDRGIKAFSLLQYSEYTLQIDCF